jgi:asparagine N-glycosylation enzyme membrane subunit Stt3
MRQLTLKLVLPLTVIAFFVFTKWMCAEVSDAPNSILQGFPLPYICTGWGSSMSWQFFVTEFVIDFLIYFLFLSLIIYLIDRFVFHIKHYKAVSITLYVVSALMLCLQILIYSRDTTFYLHRDFSIKVIESQCGFFWQAFPHCY